MDRSSCGLTMTKALRLLERKTGGLLDASEANHSEGMTKGLLQKVLGESKPRLKTVEWYCCFETREKKGPAQRWDLFEPRKTGDEHAVSTLQYHWRSADRSKSSDQKISALSNEEEKAHSKKDAQDRPRGLRQANEKPSDVHTKSLGWELV